MDVLSRDGDLVIRAELPGSIPKGTSTSPFRTERS
jgi:hypothetical protein